MATNPEFSQTFTYDPLNRLAASTLDGVANQSWTLDAQGNLTGGLAVGAGGGGRTLVEGISGNPSSVPPSWNPIGDMNH